jgi:hypothetical protein
VPTRVVRRTALAALIPEDEMSANQLEIKKISDKWKEVRQLSREEAAVQLEGDWLEAYNRFYARYDEDMTKMTEITAILQKAIDPPQIQKKTKSQKKRDKWAIVQARQAARVVAAK